MNLVLLRWAFTSSSTSDAGPADISTLVRCRYSLCWIRNIFVILVWCKFYVGSILANGYKLTTANRSTQKSLNQRRSVALKVCQNAFAAGALPQTPLGAHDASPDPYSRLGRRIPLLIPTTLGGFGPSILAPLVLSTRRLRSAPRSSPLNIWGQAPNIFF